MKGVVVLFDVDGTLVRTGGSGRRAVDRAFWDLWGVERASAGVEFAGRPDRGNFEAVFRRVFRRSPRPGELKRAMEAYLRCLPAEVRRSVREGRYDLVPGARELLRELAGRPGVRLGLGTGNLERGARIKLAPSRLNRYFRFGGYGSDHAERHRLLEAGARRAGASGAAVVVVGDTPRDVRAGRRAGFRTAAVWSGYSGRAELEASRPDLLMKDFRPTAAWTAWIAAAAENVENTPRTARGRPRRR